MPFTALYGSAKIHVFSQFYKVIVQLVRISKNDFKNLINYLLHMMKSGGILTNRNKEGVHKTLCLNLNTTQTGYRYTFSLILILH